MFTYYDNDFSTCAQKVRLLFCEKNAEWNTIWLDLRAGDQFEEDYLKLNPNGVVPTIVHNGNTIIESTLILRYLDATIDHGPTLVPTDPFDDYRAGLLMQALDNSLHSQIAALSIGIAFRHELENAHADEIMDHIAKIPNPKSREVWKGAVENGLQDTNFKTALYGWNEKLGAMDEILSKDTWLAGDAYSIADISYLPYILRLEHLGMLDFMQTNRPHLKEWYKRIKNRPGFDQAITDVVSEKKIKFVSECGAKHAEEVAALIG